MTTETAAAGTGTGATIRQVQRGSGSLGHFNLDGESFDKLHKIEKYYKALGTPVSLSVIVRRCIRVYYDYLSHLKSDTDRTEEALQLFRAIKGTEE